MNENKIELNYKLLITFAVVIPLILGVAYAYFIPKIVKDEESAVTGTAITDINYTLTTSEEDGYINVSDVIPIDDDEIDEKAAKGSFTISRPTDETNIYNLKYLINLTDITISSSLKTEDFKWRLETVDENGTATTAAEGNFNNFTGTTKTLLEGEILEPKSSVTYNIRIWIKNTDFDQCPDPTSSTCILNSNFTGKISVEAEYTLE